MRNEPRDVELKPLGECSFVKERYGDQWKIDVHWKDPRKSANPRKQRCKKRFDNPRAARRFAEEITKELEATKGATSFTFKQVVDAWLKSCEARARAKDPTLGFQTFYGYESTIKQALAKFGPMLAHQIRTRHLRAWVEDQSQKYSKRTVLGQLSMVNKALNFAQREEMLGEGRVNPLTIDRLAMRLKDPEPVRVPDRSDMQRLRDYIMGPRPYMHGRQTWSTMRVAVALAATIGLRASESCGLRWDQIDPETGEITVSARVIRRPLKVMPGTKTRAGYRKVPSNPEFRQILT
jgi:integrase